MTNIEKIEKLKFALGYVIGEHEISKLKEMKKFLESTIPRYTNFDPNEDIKLSIKSIELFLEVLESE